MKAGDFARRLALIACDRGNRFKPRGIAYQNRALRSLVKRAGAAILITHGRVIGYRLPDGGFVCEKQRFTGLDSALSELERISTYSIHKNIPVRAYRCEHCAGWHLTSKA